MNAPYAIGIDIGGTGVKAVVLAPDGEMLSETNRPFDAGRPLHFAETVRALLRSLRESQGREPLAVGICAPGLAAADQRSIARLPNRLPGMEGLDWQTWLACVMPVPVMNDAHAALLGEAWQGSARGHRNILMFTLGTGVGGAAMVDGHLLRGHSGKAGHVGHISLDPQGAPDICGTPGSLELAIGNATISERTGGRFATTHELVRAYEEGDREAAGFWLTSVHALAAGIVSLSNVLDPAMVVIGGGIAAAGDALFEPLRERVARMEWKVASHPLPIIPAVLGDKAGACGAARQALLQSSSLSHE